MIVVVGHATARADSVDEMLRISVEHVLRSRAEPGCISHEVSRDAQEPLRLTFVERWDDLAALQAHFRVEASRTFAKALAQLGAVPPEMTLYQAEAIDLAALAARRGS